MKQLGLVLTIFCFVLISMNTGNAQRSVDRIYDFYELKAYHLTIKKISNLKPKRQSRSDLQLVLADCYWKIGDRKRSARLYKNVSTVIDIPDTYQEKYTEATGSEKSQNDKINIASLPQKLFVALAPHLAGLDKITAPIQNQKSVNTKIALLTKRATLKSIVDEPLTISPVTASVFKRLNKKVLAPSELLTINDAKEKIPVINHPTKVTSSGKYRIRIGASTDLEAFNLAQMISLPEVEVHEWLNKKIVITGHYESPEKAQSFIDQYLKNFYQHAVVVTKVDGRYKSIAAAY